MVSVPPAKFIAPESHASGVLCFISSYGGGMLGGDKVSINIEVGMNSGLILLPQANSRAYTNTEGKTARQDMNIKILKGGRFIFNADPLVLHEKSKFMQNTNLFLNENSGAILIDWFSIGRSENGEKFLFSDYSSNLSISDSSSTFLIDRQHFTPDTVKYNLAGSFADYSQMLNIFFSGTFINLAVTLQQSDIFLSSENFIYSFTNNSNYTILRILGTTRKQLQSIVYAIYRIAQTDSAIGFNALERKM